MSGEEEVAEVTRFCRSFGLKKRGGRNKKGRVSEGEQIPRRKGESEGAVSKVRICFSWIR